MFLENLLLQPSERPFLLLLELHLVYLEILFLFLFEDFVLGGSQLLPGDYLVLADYLAHPIPPQGDGLGHPFQLLADSCLERQFQNFLDHINIINKAMVPLWLRIRLRLVKSVQPPPLIFSQSQP
jgi:hypothetical protein